MPHDTDQGRRGICHPGEDICKGNTELARDHGSPIAGGSVQMEDLMFLEVGGIWGGACLEH